MCEALLFCPEIKRPMREHEPFNCKILSQTGELHCLYVEYSTAADYRQLKRVKFAKRTQIILALLSCLYFGDKSFL